MTPRYPVNCDTAFRHPDKRIPTEPRSLTRGSHYSPIIPVYQDSPSPFPVCSDFHDKHVHVCCDFLVKNASRCDFRDHNCGFWNSSLNFSGCQVFGACTCTIYKLSYLCKSKLTTFYTTQHIIN